MILESVFTEGIRNLIEIAVYITMIIIIASVIAKMIAAATMRFGKEAGISHNIINLINKIITYFFAFISLILILQILGYNISTFVASFGIVGLIISILIIGIGAQAVISNIISGILIMFEKPFIIGDFVEIMGFQGKVEDIRLRSTSIKTFDGRIITVPNLMFTYNAVIQYSKTGGIQVKIPVSFKADVDIEKASQIMNSVAKSTHGIRPYSIEVLVTGITQKDPSRNVEAELRFWVNQVTDRDVIVSNITGRIKEELAKEKITTFPPPEED